MRTSNRIQCHHQGLKLAALTLLLAAGAFLFLLLLVLTAPGSKATTITVENQGGANYREIRWAVENASAGDEILVYPGSYQSGIVLDKPLSIRAEIPGEVIITPNSEEETGIIINTNAQGSLLEGLNVSGQNRNRWTGIHLAANETRISNCEFMELEYGIVGVECSGVEISNSSFRSIDDSALYLREISWLNVEQNDLVNFASLGIYLRHCDNGSLSKNSLEADTRGRGISLSNCQNITLEQNSITTPELQDISLSSCQNSHLTGNTMNSMGVSIDGEKEHWQTTRMDESNTVKGEPLRFFVGLEEGVIENISGQFILGYSSNVTIRNLNKSGYSNGLLLGHCENISLQDCNFSGNLDGLAISYTQNSSFRNISIWKNSYQGLSLVKSVNNTFTDFRFLNNEYTSINLLSSRDNVFKNCLVQKNDRRGVYLWTSPKNRFEDCIFSRNKRYGAELSQSQENHFENCSFLNNEDSGIRLNYANDNSFQNCTFAGNRWGINPYLMASSGIAVRNCSFRDNFQQGLQLVEGLLLENTSFVNDTIGGVTSMGTWDSILLGSGNTINGRPVYLLENLTTEELPQDPGLLVLSYCRNLEIQGLNPEESWGGLVVLNSENITLTGNNISRKSSGFYLENVSGCLITDNRFSELENEALLLRDCPGATIRNNSCLFGEKTAISLDHCENSTVTNNICLENKGDGIFVDNSANCSISQNRCDDNIQGIELRRSRDSVLLKNICINNSQDGIYGLVLSSCTVMNNQCQGGRNSGITIYSADDCLIENNSCLGDNKTSNGILFYQFKDSRVVGNTCLYNIGGMRLSSECQNNLIIQNNCSRNSRGIQLGDSPYPENNVLEMNTCHHNSMEGIVLVRDFGSSLLNNSLCFNQNGVMLSGVWTNFTGNLMANNTFYGLLFNGVSSNCSLVGNSFNDNEGGVYVRDGSENISIHGCNFSGNSNYALEVRYNNHYTVNATGNWWEDDSGPYLQGVHHGRGGNISELVEFSPWLSGTGEENSILIPPGQPKEPGSDSDLGTGPILTSLLFLLVLLFCLLVYFVRLPEDDFRKKGKRKEQNQGGNGGRDEEEERFDTLPRALEDGSCPHCGGKFDTTGMKRPLKFICHFCHEEIQLK